MEQKRPEPDFKAFGKRLQKVIKEKGLEQTDIVSKAKIAPTTLSAYIYGRAKPSVPALYAIAEAVGCSVDYLLGFSNDPNVYDDLQMQEVKMLYRKIHDVPDEEKKIIKDLIETLWRKNPKRTFVPVEEK